jgi:hypothetical protein
MRAYTEYWVAMLLRGFLAVLAGTAILFLTGIAATVLLLPLAIVSTILCLAAYSMVDSAIVIAASFMIPPGRPGRLVSRIQGFCGLIFGALMFSVIFDHVTITWFLYLAAAQATAVAIAEFGVARGTADHHRSRWCYVSAVIAAVSAIVLLSMGGLAHKQIAWVIYSYLGVFGLNLIAISAWMLFEQRHQIANADA